MMTGKNVAVGGGDEPAPFSVTGANRVILMDREQLLSFTLSFWSKVDWKTDPDGCWPWLGAISGCGYGYLHVPHPAGGRGLPSVECAHRVAYVLSKGPIPPGLVVRHGPTCDDGTTRQLCINPDHLKLGTHKENMADRSGGFFREQLDDLAISPWTREAMRAFLPIAVDTLEGKKPT